MAGEFTSETECLVFTADKVQYGVSYVDLVSVIDLPRAVAVPGVPPGVRGVIAFRGSSIPVVDLRVCFGAASRLAETDELLATMAARKQDHINWLQKLKEEVHGGKPISVQTNPHLCAFGKWYDHFRSDNHNLDEYMRRFDVPHQWIHTVAVDAAELIGQGKIEAAKELVHRAERGVLELLLELFDGIAGVVQRYLKEYALVFQLGGKTLAMAADDINFFGTLESLQHARTTGTANGQAPVTAIGRYRRENDGEVRDVLLLDMERLVRHLGEDGDDLRTGITQWVGGAERRAD